MNITVLPIAPLEMIAAYEQWRENHKRTHGSDPDEDAQALYLKRFLDQPTTLILMTTYISIRRQLITEHAARAN